MILSRYCIIGMGSMVNAYIYKGYKWNWDDVGWNIDTCIFKKLLLYRRPKY